MTKRAKAKPVRFQPANILVSQRVARTALYIGTALGCSIAISATPSTSHAGTPSTCTGLTTAGGVDSATCTGAGNPYPNGIQFIDTTNALNVTITGAAHIHATAGFGINVEESLAKYLYLTTDAGSSIIATDDGIDAMGGTPLVITNNASITTGGLGINAYSQSGDVTVFNDSAVSDHGLTTRALSGGVYAHSMTGNVTITNNASVTGYATGSATDFGTVGKSTNGYVYISNDGFTSENNAAGNVVGVAAEAGSDSYLKNTGNVVTTGIAAGGPSTHYYTTGVESHSTGGNAVLRQYGYVKSTIGTGNTTAIGVSTLSDGTGFTKVVGDVSVYGGDVAGGLYAATGTLNQVQMTGNLKVQGVYNATGARVEAYSGGNISFAQTGNIQVTATPGTASGLFEYGEALHSSITGNVAGAITVTGAEYASGVLQEGSGAVSSNVTGPINVTSSAGEAFGVTAASGGVKPGKYGGYFTYDFTHHVTPGAYNVSVTTGNTVTASGFGITGGVLAYGGGDATIVTNGAVSATSSRYGAAKGVDAYGEDTVSVTAKGAVTASADQGPAVGVGATSYTKGAYANVTGNVSANSTLYDATAVKVNGYSDAVANIHGPVAYSLTASAQNGVATGADITSHGAGSLTTNGNVTATGAQAYGVTMTTVGDGDISVQGAISATSSHGNAAGVSLSAGYG